MVSFSINFSSQVLTRRCPYAPSYLKFFEGHNLKKSLATCPFYLPINEIRLHVYIGQILNGTITRCYVFLKRCFGVRPLYKFCSLTKLQILADNLKLVLDRTCPVLHFSVVFSSPGHWPMWAYVVALL